MHTSPLTEQMQIQEVRDQFYILILREVLFTLSTYYGNEILYGWMWFAAKYFIRFSKNKTWCDSVHYKKNCNIITLHLHVTHNVTINYFD